jgi:hypothetical protein
MGNMLYALHVWSDRRPGELTSTVPKPKRHTTAGSCDKHRGKELSTRKHRQNVYTPSKVLFSSSTNTTTLNNTDAIYIVLVYFPVILDTH